MPSHMPSSFAAAAGQGSSRDSRNGRGDGRGSGDWARRENRPANGTLTLRRTSTTPFAQSAETPLLPTSTTDISGVTQSSNSSYEQPADFRLSKETLLQIYRNQEESGAFNGDVSELYVNGWNPGHTSAANGRSGWGKVNDNRDHHGPDVCWDSSGDVRPIAFEGMTEEEKTLFAGDVNSPLKPPLQSANKDSGTQGMGANGRRISISLGQGSSTYGGLSSPSSSRPSTRRQQTSDSISGMASPSGTGRFPRDESSPFFTRKFADPKDGSEDRADEPKNNLPFGGLMRSNTAGSVLGNGPASPWGPSTTNASMSPMGNFGNFSLAGSSANPPTPIEKRPLFGRGESRLAHLMPKESSEDIAAKAADRPWRPRQRTDTDPFSDEPPSGSAALQDTSPLMSSQHRTQGLDTPMRGSSGDFGMSDLAGFRDTMQRGQAHQTPQGRHEERDQMSPSDTNPYRSPPNDRPDVDEDSFDEEPPLHSRMQGLVGIPEHSTNSFGNLPRGFQHQNPAFDGSDRSQTSSVGAGKGFPSLGGLSSMGGMGGLAGWPTSNNPVGTPDRENRSGFPGPFGNSIFGPMGDLQSPSIGGLGNVFGAGTTGNISGPTNAGRGSKLGSLFPAAMQAQMQGVDNEGSSESGDMRSFGAIGRNAFAPSRDTDSPLRPGRHAFEDLFPQTNTSRNQAFSTSDNVPSQTSTAMPNYQQSQASSDSVSNQIPATQQRMMVMPDRMRWVYLDPQGEIQGPWSGLEMHDWYKASFFTPDLSVRKVEDSEFEPLGQLIRRIGNSREPFLVPQIGIPHGPAAPQAGAPYPPAAAGPGVGAQPGAVQPPFAGAFPSFGTTLTAEQQNNLERRKQEEQFLMARQREFLAQQQVNMKQMQMGGHPSALHHHSSAHSLQSQPSFGSMTSPIGMPPQPPLPGVASFFDSQPRQMQQQVGSMPFDNFRDEELARLNLQDRQQLFSATIAGPQPSAHPQQIASVFGQHPDAQRQAARMEQNDPQGFRARLREFEQFRAQHDLEEALHANDGISNEPIGPPQQIFQQQLATHQQQFRQEPEPEPQSEEEPELQVSEVGSLTQQLTLTQQVQNAASAKQSPVVAAQPESPWGKVNTGIPMPFPPPPQSTTPLPAPTAQRGRHNLPEALNVEARSRSETPEVASVTPSIAPWAKETVETAKGPSLKEIQEAEAKKAAKAEEIAAATRRANLEQEMKMLSLQQTAPAPGLPTSSTWGNTASPATPTNATSVWAKPSLTKIQSSSNTAASKKTLADIQREEESRKQKLAAAAAAAQPSTGLVGGKRYADLASKVTPGPAVPGNSAWSTVGAGGKVRIPTGPAAAAPQTIRSVSSVAVATTSAARIARPAPATRSVTTVGQNSVAVAKEEFNKWAKATLSKGLSQGINVDNLIASLNSFPPDVAIIADSVYAASSVLNGKDFAVEYLRRRKDADKGIFDPASVSGASESGGWSEVAKKGPPKEEPTAGFKVVPSKKKGKK